MCDRAYRFLDSMVGKEWDYVWADICRPHQDKDKGKLRKWLRDHLSDGCVVDLNIKINSKGAPYSPRWGRLLLGYWVHPITGILYKHEKGKYQYLKPKPRVVKFEGQEYAPDNNGIWYQVSLRYLSNEQAIRDFRTFGEYDVLLDMNVSNIYKLKQEYGRHAYCIAKRQINSRLKKKILDANPIEVP